MNGNDDDDDDYYGADAVAYDNGDDNNKHVPKLVDTSHEYKLTTLVKIKN
jgi:hypothetical protein